MTKYNLAEFDTWYNRSNPKQDWISPYRQHENNWTQVFLNAHDSDEYAEKLRAWMAIVDERERERERESRGGGKYNEM